MHLVYRALDGEKVPPTLTACLVPPSKRHVATSTTIVSSVSSGNYCSRSTNASTFVVRLYYFILFTN